MIPRKEKTIAIAVGAAVGLGMLYLAVSAVFLSPAAALNDKIEKVSKELENTRQSNSRKAALAGRLSEYAARTFNTDENEIRLDLRSRVTDLMQQCGVQEITKGWSAVSGDTLAKVGGEAVGKPVGWTFSVSGTLPQVVTFLNCLESKDEKYLHRIEKLVMTPKGPTVEAQVSLLTLALGPVATKSLTTMPAGALPGQLPAFGEQYAIIAARDVFRPYIKRPPAQPQLPNVAPPQPAPPPQNGNPPQAEPPEYAWTLRDLSTYGDVPEVALAQPDGSIKRLKCGQALAGATIMMVDYRHLPLPDKPDLSSWGRMILLVGRQYFAVELGKAVRDRYALSGDRLPPGLPALAAPSTAPAAAPSSQPSSAAAAPATGPSTQQSPAGNAAAATGPAAATQPAGN